MSLLKNSESLAGSQIHNYFSKNESCYGVTIGDCIDSIMCESDKWASTFEMICVSIIYSVRIINIANIKDGFMLSDSIETFKAYQISHEFINTSDRIFYLYSHIHKTPTVPGLQD